jgi:hypothetical protein
MIFVSSFFAGFLLTAPQQFQCKKEKEVRCFLFFGLSACP